MMNCNESNVYDKDYILEKFERLVVAQQAILEDCSSLLSSKVKLDDSTFEPKSSLYAAVAHSYFEPNTICYYGDSRMLKSSVPNLNDSRHQFSEILKNCSSATRIWTHWFRNIQFSKEWMVCDSRLLIISFYGLW